MQTQKYIQYNQTLPVFSAAIFNQRGHVGRLKHILWRPCGGFWLPQKGGGRSRLQTKSHVGGHLPGFQGEEVARCPLSRPCRRRAAFEECEH